MSDSGRTFCKNHFFFGFGDLQDHGKPKISKSKFYTRKILPHSVYFIPNQKVNIVNSCENDKEEHGKRPNTTITLRLIFSKRGKIGEEILQVPRSM